MDSVSVLIGAFVKTQRKRPGYGSKPWYPGEHPKSFERDYSRVALSSPKKYPKPVLTTTTCLSEKGAALGWNPWTCPSRSLPGAEWLRFANVWKGNGHLCRRCICYRFIIGSWTHELINLQIFCHVRKIIYRKLITKKQNNEKTSNLSNRPNSKPHAFVPRVRHNVLRSAWSMQPLDSLPYWPYHEERNFHLWSLVCEHPTSYMMSLQESSSHLFSSSEISLSCACEHR